jgi:ornithine decarboxylase
MSEPKFILSKSKVIGQYNKVKEFADFVTYSSKTNQDVTEILEAKTDSLFSIHFEKELKHLKDKSRAIFLAQGWDEKFIKGLIDMKINHFIVDNE